MNGPQGAPGPWPHLSFSKLSDFDRCAMYGIFKHVEKIPTPSSASQELGTELHAFQEEWLLSGKAPPESKVGRLAALGQSFLPAPGSVHVEEEFLWHGWAGADVPPLKGFIDYWQNPITTATPEDVRAAARVGLDVTTLPLIGDHKTTSDLRWAKTAHDLATDGQLSLYAAALTATGRLAADTQGYVVEHVQYVTKGALPKVQRTRVIQLRTNTDLTVKRWQSVAVRAVALAQSSDRAKLLADPMLANPKACGAYGGCPFKGVCRFSPERREEGATMSSATERLKALLGGNPSGVITPPAAPPLPAQAPPTASSAAPSADVREVLETFLSAFGDGGAAEAIVRKFAKKKGIDIENHPDVVRIEGGYVTLLLADAPPSTGPSWDDVIVAPAKAGGVMLVTDEGVWTAPDGRKVFATEAEAQAVYLGTPPEASAQAAPAAASVAAIPLPTPRVEFVAMDGLSFKLEANAPGHGHRVTYVDGDGEEIVAHLAAGDTREAWTAVRDSQRCGGLEASGRRSFPTLHESAQITRQGARLDDAQYFATVYGRTTVHETYDAARKRLNEEIHLGPDHKVEHAAPVAPTPPAGRRALFGDRRADALTTPPVDIAPPAEAKAPPAASTQAPAWVTDIATWHAGTDEQRTCAAALRADAEKADDGRVLTAFLRPLIRGALGLSILREKRFEDVTTFAQRVGAVVITETGMTLPVSDGDAPAQDVAAEDTIPAQEDTIPAQEDPRPLLTKAADAADAALAEVAVQAKAKPTYATSAEAQAAESALADKVQELRQQVADLTEANEALAKQVSELEDDARFADQQRISAEHRAKRAEGVAVGVFVLVGAVPLPGGPAVADLNERLAPMIEKIEAQHNVQHYGLIQYGNGRKQLAGMLRFDLQERPLSPGFYYLDATHEALGEILPVLTRCGAVVIRSVGR